MKIVGYQICLRITRFVTSLTLVIRPDYQKCCLRSTPGYTLQQITEPTFIQSRYQSINMPDIWFDIDLIRLGVPELSAYMVLI